MEDAWIFIPVLVLAFLLAAPAVRRWFASDERRPLVDPEQDIQVENPSPNRVRRDPPPN